MTKKEYTKPVIMEFCENKAMGSGCKPGSGVVRVQPNCDTGNNARNICGTGNNDGWDCLGGSGAWE